MHGKMQGLKNILSSIPGVHIILGIIQGVPDILFVQRLTKLALELHVNFCILSGCMYFVCMFSGLFFKASDWVIYLLLVVVLAHRLSN